MKLSVKSRHKITNRVIGGRPPEGDKRESYLPRLTRTTLAQLRLGFCARLQLYQHWIGVAPSDLCPECGTAPHSTNHILECPAHRTNLTVDDLWKKYLGGCRLPLFASLFLLLSAFGSFSSSSSAMPPLSPDSTGSLR